MASQMTAKVFTTCVLVALAMQICHGSSIPIWEFLTRNDKMHFLYSTFAQLVSTHCKATAATSAMPVNQCKRNLLNYGYDKLQTFSEAHLDALDPYQHGANELIWSSIMQGHPSSMLITIRSPVPTPSASSLIILSHQKPIVAAMEPVAAGTTSTSEQYPQNPLFDVSSEHNHKYAMDMDIAYSRPIRPETFDGSQVSSNAAATSQQQQTYLSGPLVIRVRPDGTPVEEDRYKPLPRDDDLEVFQLSTPNKAQSAQAARPNKHRKIATISALKEQHLATIALQQQLMPPLEQPRRRRQFSVASDTQPAAGGYIYGRGQT